MEKDCLFCKIINGEIPGDFLFEDDDLIVIRDINPQAPTHLLIIPKIHIRGINDMTDADMAVMPGMIRAAQRMAKEENVDQSGYKLLFNVEKGGGQVIFHLHMHLIGGWK
jgi:histidine triad (HIT) family protein